MRDDFAVFILTHGRPERQRTIQTLVELSGYTGKLYLVIDDEDETGDEYRDRYGDQVLTFSKASVAEITDTADTDPTYRGVVYARNAVWDLARQVGVRYFIVLDDDYTNFSYRMSGLKYGEDYADLHGWTIRTIDTVLEAFLRFMETTPTTTIAMSQGGDFIGGKESSSADIRLKRKAMNSFMCDTERPFYFMGRINEDVNAYVRDGRTGTLFFTYMPIQLTQLATQHNEGGLTEIYLDTGTYVKSFFTVLYAPSCTKVYWQTSQRGGRLHHKVKWNHAVPKILSADLMDTPDLMETPA